MKILSKLFLNKHFLPTLFTMGLAIVLLLIPNPFEQDLYQNTERVPARVLETDNSMMRSSGIIQTGEQTCKVEILKGQFKGSVFEGTNLLMGKLEFDKVFIPGDRVFCVIDYDETGIKYINLIDHYRLDLELILVVLFGLALVSFSGLIGLRSILSFLVTILMIWKVLIPLFLMGYNPIVIALIATITLTVCIISMVFGMDRRSLAAILGSILGTLLTAVLAIVFVSRFKIHGAIMNYSESLLYSGYQNLQLTQIFIASIFIASSGALMDVAVDITSAVHELMEKNPMLSKKEAIKSGLNVGRSVMGTMTTTLLLAYSGGYIALLMVFTAQGTPILNIFNLKYVSSEILHTLVGSFGLVTVAPFTAITSGLLLGKHVESVSEAEAQAQAQAQGEHVLDSRI
ncbi:YibE/F family protein [Fusibacter sp. 3D3]|uniref:YibE/F family protein n=1 Tax=Fusibacter sp. 3D3 TaxID=1048380 RepID=UPI000853D8FE|nr:YibE/F family protein [Fusibacter sp. 3D3]GAU78983.1 multitransmembrane protein-like [Fusibacter sp. 3D3]